MFPQRVTDLAQLFWWISIQSH